MDFIRKIRYILKQKLFAGYYKNISPNPLAIEVLPGNSFLVISPHPDDEIIGAGGTIIKLKNKDKKIRIVYNTEDKIRTDEAEKVCSELSVDYEFTGNLKKSLNDNLVNGKIDTIILPHILDNHKDHFKSVEIIYNFLKRKNCNCKIVMYEVWSLLSPNIVIDITDEIDYKMNLLSMYSSQLKNKDYLHSVKGFNAYRSIFLHDNKNRFAETFILLHNTGEFIELFEHIFSVWKLSD